MFVTAGFLAGRANEKVTVCMAGHPALLRYEKKTGAVHEYPSQNMPLGVMPELQLASEEISCVPGDILLLLTDGFTEVFDRRGAEMGSGPLVKARARCRSVRWGRSSNDYDRYRCNSGNSRTTRPCCWCAIAGRVPAEVAVRRPAGQV